MNRRTFLHLATSASVATLAPLYPSTAVAAPRQFARCLSLEHTHTGERLEIAYRAGSRYRDSALTRINHFLRDWRTGQVAQIDPELLDIAWDLTAQLGEVDTTIQIISGYRSPKTNAMLRRTSSGVAKRSLHLEGRAIDLRIAGQSVDRVHRAAVRLGRGGVGSYSGSRFTHIDTGPVREWRG